MNNKLNSDNTNGMPIKVAEVDFSKLSNSNMKLVSEQLKAFDKQLNPPKITNDMIQFANTKINYQIEPVVPDDYFDRQLNLQEKGLEILESINTNTANLYALVALVRDSGDKQDEIINLLSEILLLAKVEDKADAESKFKKIIGKITETVDSAESIMKLVGFAETIYNALPFA